jgi:hypothetical protein
MYTLSFHVYDTHRGLLLDRKGLLDVFTGGLNVIHGGITIDNSITAITPLIVVGGVSIGSGVCVHILCICLYVYIYLCLLGRYIVTYSFINLFTYLHGLVYIYTLYTCIHKHVYT